MKIAFLDYSTKLVSIDDLKVRPRGGMISSLFKISDHLSRCGHRVTVLSDIREGGTTPSGVDWIRQYDGQAFDVLVLNRGIGNGYPTIRADHRILWTHDLPHDGFVENKKNLHALTATVFMSRYSEAVWRTLFPQIGRSVYIPNGVDRELFYPSAERDWHRIIFASAPNRGLRRVNLIFEGIRGHVPTATMEVYSRTEVLHPDRHEDGWGAPEVPELFEESRGGTDVEPGEGISYHDPIPQAEFAERLRTSGMMLVPTDYPETCCNLYLQSLACGVPVVTTGGIGSAGEWVRHGRNGMLTRFQPADYVVYFVEMARNAIDVLKDESFHARMSMRAATTPGLYSWDEIGSSWNRMLRKLCA